MDRSSSKRGAGGLVVPRKAYSSTPVKDSATARDQNAQLCNRNGCSGRIDCNQSARIRNSDKSKCSKPSCSSDQNDITRKFPISRLVMTSAKKSPLDSKRKMSSQGKPDASESSLSGDLETPELVSSPSNLNGYQSESVSEPKEGTTKARSSSVSSNVGSGKILHHKFNENTPSPSFVPSDSGSSPLEPYNGSNGTRSGPRNLKCKSLTHVATPSCSPLESGYVVKNTTKKRSSEGESSNLSHRGRKITPPPVDRHISPTSSGISISDSSRSSASTEDDRRGTAAIWARRSVNANTRMIFSGLQNGRRNNLSVRESAASSSQIHDNGRPFSGSRFNNQSSRMPFTTSETGRSHLMNQDVLNRYNMDRIAELLLSLERIHQDDELTHEAHFSLSDILSIYIVSLIESTSLPFQQQILALETSLFLSGLNLYDQHRDMRLDIDNMSYEELLALEERMGTVSTALSEEALSKCIRRSTYQLNQSDLKITEPSSKDVDDTKCSICQEEYVNGDEIGKLVECHHGYHATCINQWLQLKNWCPICKASAEPLQSSSSL